MPPGRKPSHSREEYVEAAIAYADEHGIEALTLRALGSTLGVSATAVYRYFPDKEQLIVGMRETLIAQAFASLYDSPDPREALISTALAYRAMARRHPCLSQIMTVRVEAGDTSLAVPTVVGEALVRLGLSGRAVALAYRQLESFVVGTSVFDFSDAPHHLEERLDRLRHGSTDVSAGLTSVDDVDLLNEEAFEASLRTLVSSIAAQDAVKE